MNVTVRVRRLALLLLMAGVSLFASPQFSAAETKVVTSRSGLSAWLAEDHSSGVVALRFAFLGGSAEEPADKAGITRLLAGMLGEEAGGDGDNRFRKRVELAGMRLSFQAGRDALFGSADLLSPFLEESVQLLGEAVSRPLPPVSVLERVRTRLLDDIAEGESDPRAVANRRWYAEAFPSEGYAREPEGTVPGLGNVHVQDVAELRARTMTRSRLVVVAAGDISESQLSNMLDAVFGDLASGEGFTPQPIAAMVRGTVRLSGQALTSSAIAFGTPAPPPGDRDFAAMLVLTHVLGSGDLDSRLLADLRVRDGLVYAAQAGVLHDTRAAVLLGGALTANAKVDAAEAALRATIARLMSEGAAEAEIAAARTSLASGGLLSVDSTRSLADAMLYARLDGESPDFLKVRQAALAAVTAGDVQRVAAKYLAPDRLLVVIAGGQR